jgi:hypothetical protein
VLEQQHRVWNQLLLARVTNPLLQRQGRAVIDLTDVADPHLSHRLIVVPAGSGPALRRNSHPNGHTLCSTMYAAPLVRLRWRLRGAWLWPLFVVLTLADGVIHQQLPITGDTPGSFVGGVLAGAVLNLIAIVVLAGPLGRVVRWVRPDMPRVVANNYAGAFTTIAITAVLVAAGLVHRPVITNELNALDDATARAEAYIGAHASARFQQHLDRLSTYEVQPPEIYRTCAEADSAADPRFYCVTVNRGHPFGKGVYYAGSESNTQLAEGTS